MVRHFSKTFSKTFSKNKWFKNFSVLFLTIYCVLFVFPANVQAKISATVDRSIVEEGETFKLTIQADEDPNIDGLNRDFNVLGTSQSSKVSIINGSVNSVKEWVISLVPKRVGSFVIPSIRAGKDSSAPIRIQVKKPTFTRAGQGADIFLEAKVDLPTVYVQSQVLYTVRLFRAVEIREGSLTEPKLSNAVVERLGEDVTFQTRRNGRLYQVTERRFAIFPQKSGKFVIAPTVFQGQVSDNRNNGQRSNDPFDRFFQSQRTKRVRVKSGPIEVFVDAQPKDVEGDTWLPAKRLILLESWSQEPLNFKVGEPITRTLRMEATGLTAAQLPEIKPFSAIGVKQYADQPTIETKLKGGVMVGIREEKFAIVPTQSGQLVLPEIRLPWWNTEMNRQEVISIPPKIIDVAPGELLDPTTASNQQMDQKPNSSASPVITKETIKTVVEAGYWPILAIASIIAWLLTSIAWVFHWRSKYRKVTTSKPFGQTIDNASLSTVSKQLKKACDKNDAMASKQALLRWAQIAWPTANSPSLAFLLHKLENPKLNQPFNDLNKMLYSANDETWDGQDFWLIVGPCLKNPRTVANNAVESLPELYPQHG